MSQPISPSVLKRESEGIGRLHAAGIRPDCDWIRRSVGGLPPHKPRSNPTCFLEADFFTVSQIADGLCTRSKTVRDYIHQAGLDPMPVSETRTQIDEAVTAKRAGEIDEDEFNDIVDDILRASSEEGPQLVDCETLALWLFETGKHRARHRWAWWWLEHAAGTWSPESGYISASPMTRAEWEAASST